MWSKWVTTTTIFFFNLKDNVKMLKFLLRFFYGMRFTFYDLKTFFITNVTLLKHKKFVKNSSTLALTFHKRKKIKAPAIFPFGQEHPVCLFLFWWSFIQKHHSARSPAANWVRGLQGMVQYVLIGIGWMNFLKT